LAIITGVLGRIRKRSTDDNLAGLGKTLDRGERNVKRLLDLQIKIDDILNQRSVEEKKRIIKIIEDAVSFVEEYTEESYNQNVKILQDVSERLEFIYSSNKITIETIPLDEFLHGVCNKALSSIEGRNLKIIRNFPKEMFLDMDRNILYKLCGGILKNAIENTPDEGIIEINARLEDDEICIAFQDYGVGITPQNQKLIFGGFFHTQDTNLYSSKKPYEFNAGGSGSDLLRTKVFSERYGFSVDFDSTRCKFIPTDREVCPGRISACQSITKKSDCLSSGGSVFSIKFSVSQ
jgi:signal transduction histidine kinase